MIQYEFNHYFVAFYEILDENDTTTSHWRADTSFFIDFPLKVVY